MIVINRNLLLLSLYVKAKDLVVELTHSYVQNV